MSQIKYDFSDQLLVLMMGLPYAGKSTTADKLSQVLNAPIVSPDAVRVALHGLRFSAPAEPLVWWVTRMMVRALFLTGHPVVILDSTANTRKRRDVWRGPEAWETVICPVATPVEVCLGRARAAEDDEIVPVIERMVDERELPGPDEDVNTFAGLLAEGDIESLGNQRAQRREP